MIRPFSDIKDVELINNINQLAHDLQNKVFTWSSTPQGNDYWSQVFHNLKNLAIAHREVIAPIHITSNRVKDKAANEVFINDERFVRA